MLTNKKTIHIEWGHCDPLGIVYYPRYFEFFDACTNALFELAGLPKPQMLKTYAIGRLVPSGTMTAVAVAYGYRFGGIPGTVIALSALILPSLTVTLVLTMAYGYLRSGPFLSLLPVTLIPAALGFVLVSAVKMGREVFRPSLDLVIALAALHLFADSHVRGTSG